MSSWTLPNRWKAAISWVSIALNIFLLGLVIGGAWMAPPPPPPPPHHIIDHLADQLAGKDRETFLATFAPHREALRTMTDAMHDGFTTFQAAMGAEPFDKKAFITAKNTMETERSRFETLFVETMAEALSRISPEGRRKIGRFPPGPPPPPD